MTLHNDRPRKNLRPPMRPAVMWIWIGGAVAVLVFVAVILVVSGRSLF